MIIQVANVVLANTFSHWLARTNEMAHAMSTVVVTVGGEATVGDAVIHGSISSNVARVDEVTSFSGADTVLKNAAFVLDVSASIDTQGDMNVNGALNVGAVSTVKIAGSNATHQVLAATDANGTMGFIKVQFPLDDLTDVDTSNVAEKNAETIIKWNPSTSHWEANTLSLINQTRINSLNVGTVTSTLVVSANARIGNDTLFVNEPAKRVGINTLTPTSALTVNGSILASGDISGFQTSDETFKTNIRAVDAKHCLDLINMLEVKNFDWIAEQVEKSDYASDMNFGADTGLIAQQVQQILPNMVMKRPDGTLAVNYAKLIPYLLASIQYLSNK